MIMRKHDIRGSLPHFRVLHEKFQKEEEKLIKKLNDDFYAIRKENNSKAGLEMDAGALNFPPREARVGFAQRRAKLRRSFGSGVSQS